MKTKDIEHRSFKPNDTFEWCPGYICHVKYCENIEESDIKLRKWFVIINEKPFILPEIYLNSRKYPAIKKIIKFNLRGPLP